MHLYRLSHGELYQTACLIFLLLHFFKHILIEDLALSDHFVVFEEVKLALERFVEHRQVAATVCHLGLEPEYFKTRLFAVFVEA